MLIDLFETPAAYRCSAERVLGLDSSSAPDVFGLRAVLQLPGITHRKSSGRTDRWYERAFTGTSLVSRDSTRGVTPGARAGKNPAPPGGTSTSGTGVNNYLIYN